MMDCMLPICNMFLFYYIYIVFDLSFTQIIRIKIGQVIIFRYFHKIMVKAIFTITVNNSILVFTQNIQHVIKDILQISLVYMES